MPTIWEHGPYRFFFYSGDRDEPSHVHVERERNKANDIWKRYRMRPEQYQEFIKDGCAVCGTHEDLCVDHDHSCCPGSRTCGKCIRGALCKKHNRGEACFEDTGEIMQLLAYRLNYDKKN